MRRTAADRRAEAARAQQMTEQRGLNPVWIATHPDKLIQDRKTGEFYNPQQRFDELMNKPETMAMLKRLAVR
jgi:hypothetical protein